jgi:hypothetical protein
VDDCLSYFSLLAPSAESIQNSKNLKNENINEKINEKNKKISNSKSNSNINNRKNSKINQINNKFGMDEEEEGEASFAQMECSSEPRIPALLFERWHRDYFDLEQDINPLDVEKE